MKVRIKLVEKRKELGLSLRKAAEILEIQYQNLYFIEKCMQDGSLSLWKKIQKGYDIKDKDMWSFMTTYKYVVEKKDKSK